MKKKSVNYLSYIPVAVMVVGLIGGWFKITAMAETTKAKVDKLEDKVDKVEDKSGELEKSIEVNKTQQDNIQREVQKIADKTDKILDAIVAMKK